MQSRVFVFAFLAIVLGCGHTPDHQQAEEPDDPEHSSYDAWTRRLGVSSAAEIPLRKLDRKVIDLSSTDITDDEFASLQHFNEITSLNISSTLLTDGIAEDILTFRSLRELDLVFTQVTGAGIRQLGDLPSMTTMHVWHEQLDDDGLAGLGAMQTLSRVYLWVPDLGDEGETLPPKIKAVKPEVHVEVMWYVHPLDAH